MLVQYVARHREQVRLWIADGLLMIDPQQSQIDLLGQIRHVVGIAQVNG